MFLCSLEPGVTVVTLPTQAIDQLPKVRHGGMRSSTLNVAPAVRHRQLLQYHVPIRCLSKTRRAVSDPGLVVDRDCSTICSVQMLLDNAPGQLCPGCLLMNIVNKWTDTG